MSSDSTTNSFVDVSKQNSRQPSPFVSLPHPDHYRSRQDGDEDGASNFAWDETEWPSEEGHDMPSDLRPEHASSKSHQHQPLLTGGKRTSYDSPIRPGLGARQPSHFRERDPDIVETKDDTKRRYTYAAAFLLISLVSFAVQTETAVYIQHNLHWNKVSSIRPTALPLSNVSLSSSLLR